MTSHPDIAKLAYGDTIELRADIGTVRGVYIGWHGRWVFVRFQDQNLHDSATENRRTFYRQAFEACFVRRAK